MLVPRNVIKKKEVAIVTGGSRGIGFEVSKGLAEAGYHVIIASRNEMEAEEAIFNIKKATPKANGNYMCSCNNNFKKQLVWSSK